MAMTAMVETVTEMAKVMAMMLLPLPMVTMLMTMAVAFEDSDWKTAIGQQQWDNHGVCQQ